VDDGEPESGGGNEPFVIEVEGRRGRIAISLSLMWSMPLDTAALNVRGYRPPIGPVLGETPRPEVL
jgi:hypothetical protein